MPDDSDSKFSTRGDLTALEAQRIAHDARVARLVELDGVVVVLEV